MIRSRRIKSTKPPTTKQLACRQKMRIAKSFIGAFTAFVKIGFGYAVTGKTCSACDAAVGWQIKNAVTGDYPDQTINYAAVSVTRGPLPTDGINASAQFIDNKLVFTWTPDYSYLHAGDRVMLLAYSPGLNEAVYTLWGAKRNTGTDQLMLPVSEWDGAVETYLSFITENGNKCTNSIYTGRFDIGKQF